MDWYESIYDNMSISKISTPVADSVVCGEANYVEYEYITDPLSLWHLRIKILSRPLF